MAASNKYNPTGGSTYLSRYNSNVLNKNSTSTGIRSLSSSIEPSSVGTSWNSVRWNKTQPTDAYRSSRITKAFQPSTSTTKLTPNSYSLSPGPSRYSSDRKATPPTTSFNYTPKLTPSPSTTPYRSTSSYQSGREKNDMNSTGYQSPRPTSTTTNANSSYFSPSSRRSVSTASPLSRDHYSRPSSNYCSVASDYLNATRKSTTKHDLYSAPSNQYLKSNSRYEANALAITGAIASTKTERPWRQRLADSARLRNLEGTGDIATQVSSSYMAHRAARRNSITSGDEMGGPSLKLINHKNYLLNGSASAPLVPPSLTKSTSSVEGNDSGIMSKSGTSRSSWATSIISNKSVSPIFELEPTPTDSTNNANQTPQHSLKEGSPGGGILSSSKVKDTDCGQMESINSIENGYPIKTSSSRKSIKYRTARRNSRKTSVNVSKEEGKELELVDSGEESSEQESGDPKSNSKLLTKQDSMARKKKRKPRKREDLKPPESTEDMTKCIKETKIVVAEPKKIPPKPVVVAVYDKPNTNYIKRTPIKKYVEAASKPIVVETKKKEAGDINCKDDESKYNGIAHFKPAPLIALNDPSTKKVPPIPGKFKTEDAIENISVNKAFDKKEQVQKAEKTFLVKKGTTKDGAILKVREPRAKKVLKKPKSLPEVNITCEKVFVKVTDNQKSCTNSLPDKSFKNTLKVTQKVLVPKKPEVNVTLDFNLTKAAYNNKLDLPACKSLLQKGLCKDIASFICKEPQNKTTNLNLDVYKKVEERKAHVTVLTAQIMEINLDQLVCSVDASVTPRILTPLTILTPKAASEEIGEMDVSLTLSVKPFFERASAPPDSLYFRRNNDYETRASIVLKRLRSEDPSVYDTIPSTIPEYSQRYAHLTAEPSYRPGDPIVLPDHSLLEEYVRRKRGNLEKLIHDPIYEEPSAYSPTSTISRCDSPSLCSTISEYHPACTVKIVEPTAKRSAKLIIPKRNYLTTTENNNSTSSLLDMVTFNAINKPTKVTNVIESFARKPLRTSDNTQNHKINNVFEKPLSAFEQQMQNQAFMLKKSNSNVGGVFGAEKSNVSPPYDTGNNNVNVTWTLPEHNKRSLSMDNGTPSTSNAKILSEPPSNHQTRPSLAQTFTQAAALASQPRHERYAAHIPVTKINEGSGRQSTTSMDSNNSAILDKASTHLDQMIDHARFKHQQHRNKFKDAIDYLDQIFEDFKKDVEPNPPPTTNNNNRFIKPTAFPTTTNYQNSNVSKLVSERPIINSNSLDGYKVNHNSQSGGSYVSNNGRMTASTAAPVTNSLIANNLKGFSSKPAPHPAYKSFVQAPQPYIGPKKTSYSQQNSLCEDLTNDVSETITLPNPTKKLSSDRLDFTQKWLVGDIKAWAHSPKPDTIPQSPPEPANFDYDERSLGSCSAEVAAINSSDKKKRSNGDEEGEASQAKKPALVNNNASKPHIYRPQPINQPFPIPTMSFEPSQVNAIRKVPSIDQMTTAFYQPTGSQFFKPPSMQSLNELGINQSSRAQSQEYQSIGSDFGSGIYMKPTATIPSNLKAPKGAFGSIQSLPDSNLFRNQNNGSFKKGALLNDKYNAIDALVAELEMGVDGNENNKRRSFPLNGNNQPQTYTQIQKDLDKSKGPLKVANNFGNKKNQLDEVVGLLNSVGNEVSNPPILQNYTAPPRRIYPQKDALKQSRNPFEKINNERIGSSKVEAMHNMFETNKDSYNGGHFSQGSKLGGGNGNNLAWKRHSINQKPGPQKNNSHEEDNYYEITDFPSPNLRGKTGSKCSLNTTNYQEYVPTYPNTHPPSFPPTTNSGNSSNHGYYSSTNSSSATITQPTNGSLQRQGRGKYCSGVEASANNNLSRHNSFTNHHHPSLRSRDESVEGEMEEDDDGFYDNILGMEERRFSRGSDLNQDNLSMSSQRQKERKMISDESSGMVVLTGNSHPNLSKLVCEKLGIRLGDAVVYNKTNRETSVDVKQSVRGKHVFIIQSADKNVNNNIMELLIMIYACKTSSSKTITVVFPYLPYSQQCRMYRRSAITMKLVADMICKAGASRLVSLDLYKKEIQGFFSIPVDNLRSSPFLLQYIKENIADYKNAVIVAKSPGTMHKATSFADRLRLSIAVIHGDDSQTGSEEKEDGRQSPPMRSSGSLTSLNEFKNKSTSYELYPSALAKEKPPLTIVGDVGGRIAIIVDDIIDEAHSFVSAAEVLKKRGAYKVYVVAVHGILSGDAPRLLEDSCIDQVVVTNTVPCEIQQMRCYKIKVVDVSIILSEAIRRIYHKESLGILFRDVTLDD
uniref:Pribosyltran_N domain-containing protein n=1 Tax=Rhabditophanes sp. KR3021 TaxID=114890 RepID=A0AC35U9W1_9BILA